MSRFSMWDPRKNEDYQFFDETIQEMFEVGATSIFVYKYLGVGTDGTDPTAIEDPVFMENRQRNYDTDVYELLGVYNVQDTEFDLTQFGQMVSADIIYMEFHLNDSIRRLGRKLMAGDVFEFPHLRDDALLREDTPAINKYYVVEDVSRDPNGYSPTWYPHLIRVKLRVLTNATEYQDILNQPPLDANGDPIPGGGNGPNSLEEILSDYQQQIDNNERVVEEAEAMVDRRNFETQHFYVVPGDELGKQYPWIFAGDGIPPNGAVLTGTGTSFPTEQDFPPPQNGDYFLRTDYEPHVLFRRDGAKWRRQEVDWRKRWQAAHRILESFINNDAITTVDGVSAPEKVAISKAVTIKADL